jgi:hypothetical protein
MGGCQIPCKYPLKYCGPSSDGKVRGVYSSDGTLIGWRVSQMSSGADALTTTKRRVQDQAEDLSLQIDAIAKAVVSWQQRHLSKAEEAKSVQTLQALSQLLTTVDDVLAKLTTITVWSTLV